MSEQTTAAGAATDTTTAAAGATQATTQAATTDATKTILGGDAKTDTTGTTDADKAKAEADAKAKADADAAAAKAKAEGAPEKYEFKPPEGIGLAPEALTKFEKLAREANLPQAKADAFLNMAIEHVREQQKTSDDAYAAQVTKWAGEAKSDQEIGGQRFDESIKFAQQAVREIGTPELAKVLNETGLGNHPELVRVFVRVGRAMAEGKFVQGSAAGGEKSLAERLYPTMKSGS